MRLIYDLRSRLVHGSLSPFDLEVRSRRIAVLDAVEAVPVNGLMLFGRNSLFDRNLGRRELKAELAHLIDRARKNDSAKRARQAATPQG